MTTKNKRTYLNNHVVIESLKKHMDLTGRFRGGDERGEVAMIAANSKINHVEIAEFSKKGIKRGFHYHKKYIEQIYVVYGAILISAHLIDNKSRKIQITLKQGDLITIHPKIAHAFLSLKKALVLSVGSGPHPFKDRKIYIDIHFRKEKKSTL